MAYIPVFLNFSKKTYVRLTKLFFSWLIMRDALSSTQHQKSLSVMPFQLHQYLNWAVFHADIPFVKSHLRNILKQQTIRLSAPALYLKLKYMFDVMMMALPMEITWPHFANYSHGFWVEESPGNNSILLCIGRSITETWCKHCSKLVSAMRTLIIRIRPSYEGEASSFNGRFPILNPF